MEQNERYERMKREHPNWSDEQIWTAISMDMSADNIIDDIGGTEEFDTQSVLTQVLEGAREWLEATLPVIYAKVKTFFQEAFRRIGEVVGRGIKAVKELISILFEGFEKGVR